MNMQTRAIFFILLLLAALVKMPPVTFAAGIDQSSFQPSMLAGISSSAGSVFSGAGETIRGWLGGVVCYFISCPNGESVATKATVATTAVAVSKVTVPTSTTKTVHVPVNASHPTQSSYIYPATSGNSGSGLTMAEVDARIQTALEKALGAQAYDGGQNVTYAPVYQQIANQTDSIGTSIGNSVSSVSQSLTTAYTSAIGSAITGGMSDFNGNSLNVSSSTTIGGALSAGTTTLSSLNVSGDASVGGALTVGSLVSGGQTIGGNFSVTGTTTLNNLVATNSTSTSLYSTMANLASAIFGNATSTNLFANALSIGSLNGLIWGTNGSVGTIATSSLKINTNDLTEGSNNLFFTVSRASTTAMAVLAATTSLPNITALAGLTSASSLATVGTLTSGSIGSGFGNINIGLNTFTGNGSGLTSLNASNVTSGTLAVANGGTGQTTYTDGQLLIGNSTGNTFTPATLTGTPNEVSITNGAGSITLSTPQAIDSTARPTFASTTLTNFTAGSIPFFSTGGSLNQNNANLFWDNTNNRLGVGSSTPGYPLSVNGAGFFGGNLTATGTLTAYGITNNGTITSTATSTASAFVATSATATSIFAGILEANNLYDSSNVRYWGAKGDGITDDSAAFASAIASGKNVSLDYGDTYLISTPLNLTASQQLYGNGATIKRANQATTTTNTTITGGVTNVITVADASNFRVGESINMLNGGVYDDNNKVITNINGNVITTATTWDNSASGTTIIFLSFVTVTIGNNGGVYNLTIDGNKSNWTYFWWAATKEILLSGVHNIADSNYVHDAPGEGIYAGGNYNTVRNNYVLNVNGNGIHLSGTNHPIIEDNTVINGNLNTAVGHADGCIIWSNAIAHATVTNNYMENCIAGIGSIDSPDNSDVTVANNTIVNMASYAIEGVLPNNTGVQDIVFTGNRIYNSKQAVFSNTSDGTNAWPSRIIFSNNYLSSTTLAITRSQYITVSNNIIDMVTNTSNVVAYIQGSQQIIFSGNSVIGGAYGIYVNNLATTTSDVTISDNTFTNQYNVGVDLYDTNMLNVQATNNVISATTTSSGSYNGIIVNSLSTARGNTVRIASGNSCIQAYNNAIIDSNHCTHGSASYTITTFGGSSGIIITNNVTDGAIHNSGGNANYLFNNNIGSTADLWLVSSQPSLYTLDNVGIGTTSPSAKLSIAGSANGTTPLFAISTSTSSGTTTVFQLDKNGVLTMNTPGATSTINGNLYVNGTLRSTTSYNGDLIFANDFRFTEAPLDGTLQGLLVKNQDSQQVLSIDENGNLTTTGDICANTTNCFSNFNTSLASLSSEVNAMTSVSSTTATSTDWTAAIADLSLKVDALSSTTVTLSSSTALLQSNQTSTSTIASSTASTLSSSTSFIQTIASAVQNMIQSAGNWIVNQVTAVTGIFTNLTATTATVNTANVQTLCVGSTCVTEAQLQQLLQKENVTAAVVSTPVITTTTTATTTATTSIDTASLTTSTSTSATIASSTVDIASSTPAATSTDTIASTSTDTSPIIASTTPPIPDSVITPATSTPPTVIPSAPEPTPPVTNTSSNTGSDSSTAVATTTGQ
ncbi:MAG TPA: right-handed parallel beta-helix repeat-containing protein [Candidatus Saccharimonadales bacterium]|nr:right-handed parallel beta-helix repeat-containing protein [Candidatus Saccharimonadales bacterium]